MSQPSDRSTHILETERLVLRPAHLRQLDDLHRLHSDPFVVASIFDGNQPTPRQTRKQLLDYVEQWRRHGFGYWLAYLKRSGSGERPFVGRTGLKVLEGADDVEVAHCFFLAYSGHGFALEAARAAIAFGFRRAGLEKIVCVVRPANFRSLRVTEKLGFRYVEDRRHHGKTMRYFELNRSEMPRLEGGSNGSA